MTETKNLFHELGKIANETFRKITGQKPDEEREAFSQCVQFAASGLAKDQDHYNACGPVQPIEAMQASMDPQRFIGKLQGDIIKYAMRAGKKGDERSDVQKIIQYATWWLEALNGKTIDPREPGP